MKAAAFMPARQPSDKLKIPIHARVDRADVAELDRAAAEELITRSQIVARLIREWADTRRNAAKQPRNSKKRDE
jgi:hypothetical protein